MSNLLFENSTTLFEADCCWSQSAIAAIDTVKPFFSACVVLFWTVLFLFWVCFRGISKQHMVWSKREGSIFYFILEPSQIFGIKAGMHIVTWNFLCTACTTVQSHTAAPLPLLFSPPELALNPQRHRLTTFGKLYLYTVKSIPHWPNLSLRNSNRQWFTSGKIEILHEFSFLLFAMQPMFMHSSCILWSTSYFWSYSIHMYMHF